jgi:hypothetical protein
MVPSEKKRVNVLLATIFAFNFSLYFLSPALTVAGNPKMRDFLWRHLQTAMTEATTYLGGCRKKCFRGNQVVPSP